MADATKPKDREALIELRARQIAEGLADGSWNDVGHDFDLPGWRNSCRDIARATLEAEEAAGVVCVPAILTPEQKDAIKAQPHSYMHSISSMWEAVKARNPYAKEG